MCTVIIHVGESASEPIRLIAIRDEDPARPWNPLGRWWPDTHSGVVGVRDVRAGGAWLAADPDDFGCRSCSIARTSPTAGERGRLARLDRPGVGRRRLPGERPRTHGFNLVEVVPGSVRVTMWDGIRALRSARTRDAHDRA